MKLTKLSETKHEMDRQGTLNVSLGKDYILKISPAEILVAAKEVMNKIPIEERRKVYGDLRDVALSINEEFLDFGDILNPALSLLSIPESVQSEISLCLKSSTEMEKCQPSHEE
jgi:hypothetical protein